MFKKDAPYYKLACKKTGKIKYILSREHYLYVVDGCTQKGISFPAKWYDITSLDSITAAEKLLYVPRESKNK